MSREIAWKTNGWKLSKFGVRHEYKHERNSPHCKWDELKQIHNEKHYNQTFERHIILKAGRKHVLITYKGLSRSLSTDITSDITNFGGQDRVSWYIKKAKIKTNHTSKQIGTSLSWMGCVSELSPLYCSASSLFISNTWGFPMLNLQSSYLILFDGTTLFKQVCSEGHNVSTTHSTGGSLSFPWFKGKYTNITN